MTRKPAVLPINNHFKFGIQIIGHVKDVDAIALSQHGKINTINEISSIWEG